MPESESHKKWVKENMTKITILLHNKNDKDILQALEGTSKSTEIKRLLRIALEKPYRPGKL